MFNAMFINILTLISLLCMHYITADVFYDSNNGTLTTQTNLLSETKLNKYNTDNYKLKFVADYLQLKPHLNIVTLFICYSDKISFQSTIFNEIKMLTNMKAQINLINIDENNSIDFMTNIHHSDHIQFVIIDMDCENAKNYLEMGSSNDLFNSTYRWLILGTNLNETVIDLWFKQLNIHVGSDITVVNLFHNQKGEYNATLYDVWKPSHQHNPIDKTNITLIGHGFSTKLPNLKLQYIKMLPGQMMQRKNMKGLRLRVILVIRDKKFNDPVNFYMGDTSEKYLDTLPRVSLALHGIVKDMFNLTYYFQRTKSWGYFENGRWDGLVGALFRGESDIGGSSAVMFEERLKAITLIGHGWTERPCFIFRQPDDPNALRNIFLLPFSTNIWICILLCSFLVIIIFSYFHYIEEEGENKKENFCKVKKAKYWTKSIIQTIGVLCQQGISEPVDFFSGRCVSITVLLFSFLINQFYSASIVSALLTETPKTIKTIRHLIDSPLQLYIEDTLFMKHYFTSTTNPDAIDLYNRKLVNIKNEIKEDESHFIKTDVGVKMVKLGGTAFHIFFSSLGNKIMSKTFTEKEACGVTEISIIPPSSALVMLPKNSHFREILAYSYRRMTETGVLARELNFWKTPKPKCVRNKQSDDFQVKIQYIYSILFLLSAGHMLSLMFLLLEIFYAKYCDQFY